MTNPGDKLREKLEEIGVTEEDIDDAIELVERLESERSQDDDDQ